MKQVFWVAPGFENRTVIWSSPFEAQNFFIINDWVIFAEMKIRLNATLIDSILIQFDLFLETKGEETRTENKSVRKLSRITSSI